MFFSKKHLNDDFPKKISKENTWYKNTTKYIVKLVGNLYQLEIYAFSNYLILILKSYE